MVRRRKRQVSRLCCKGFCFVSMIAVNGKSWSTAHIWWTCPQHESGQMGSVGRVNEVVNQGAWGMKWGVGMWISNCTRRQWWPEGGEYQLFWINGCQEHSTT